MGKLFNFHNVMLVGFAIAATVVAGCNDGPPMVSVTGLVTLDGNPVPDAAVVFEPTQSGPIGAATTDSEGKFKLVTSTREGLIPGEYRASVTKYEMLGIDPNKPGDFTNAKMQWVVPEKYSQMATSGLMYKIDKSDDALEVQLISQ